MRNFGKRVAADQQPPSTVRISAGKAWEFDTPKASISALFAPHIKREVRRNLTKTKTPPRTITGLSCRAPIGAHGIDLKMPAFIGLQVNFWHKERIHTNYAPG